MGERFGLSRTSDQLSAVSYQQMKNFMRNPFLDVIIYGTAQKLRLNRFFDKLRMTVRAIL